MFFEDCHMRVLYKLHRYTVYYTEYSQEALIGQIIWQSSNISFSLFQKKHSCFSPGPEAGAGRVGAGGAGALRDSPSLPPVSRGIG